jgi:hypothetical protein
MEHRDVKIQGKRPRAQCKELDRLVAAHVRQPSRLVQRQERLRLLLTADCGESNSNHTRDSDADSAERSHFARLGHDLLD